MQIIIPKQVEEILAGLRADGYEAFAVGGCVRDTLLGRVPGDWDITTSARPEQVKKVFGKTIDTGLQHGTVTVMREHVGYEITTYRIDGEYEDARHPKEVAFTSDLKEDLRRRDFTINAMAYSHETGIVDIFGGMKDLKEGVVRCVGNAVERFTEDALRILRAIRFSAQLNFTIEDETYAALTVIAPNLANVSKERIQAELTKTLLSDHPERILLVEETGMSPYISAGFHSVFGTNIGRVREACMRASGLPARKSLRWAAFLSYGGEDCAAQILKELKMDNDTTDRVKTLVRWFSEELQEDDCKVREVMSSMEDGRFDELLLLKESLLPEEAAGTGRIRKTAEAVRSRGDCIRMRDMAVTGKDLIAAGVRPGPDMGNILQRLFLYMLKHPECNEKEYLLNMAVKKDTEE